MEHSAEEIIRAKILDTEQSTVAWNKEWVWSRIETPPQRKKIVVWYAAAAILIGLFSGTMYWVSKSQENTLMVQLDKLELGIEHLTASITNVPTEVIERVCEEEESPSATKIPDNKTFVERAPTQSQIAAASIDVDPVIQLVDDTPLTISVSIQEPKLNILEQVRVITPIIGKIPVSQPSVAATKSKELKIRVFQARNTQEHSVVDNREYKLLTARFNNN